MTENSAPQEQANSIRLEGIRVTLYVVAGLSALLFARFASSVVAPLILAIVIVLGGGVQSILMPRRM